MARCLCDDHIAHYEASRERRRAKWRRVLTWLGLVRRE